MKFTFLFLAIACLFISGCKSDSVTSSGTSTESYYELPIGSDSTLTHYFGVTIVENNGAVTGSAVTIDSAARNKGTITGTVSGSSISFNSSFPVNKYDFEFVGTKSTGIISGKLVFKNPSMSLTADTLKVALLTSKNKVLEIGDSVINPYLFKTIFTTPSPTGQPVIFVHGMGATIAEWDSLFASLDAGFKSRHNVYAYQYNWQDSILINGRILKDSVLALGIINPIIIAHSMGGLVSRGYVASGGHITKLVTLGTPHLGTELANILPYAAPSLNSAGPRDMSVGGHYISSMLANPLDMENRNKYYCISGQMGGHFQTTSPFQWVWNEPYYKDIMNGIVCIGWKVLRPFGNNDGLVPVASAFFEGAAVNKPFPTPQYYVDHMHLVFPGEAPVIFNYINAL